MGEGGGTPMLPWMDNVKEELKASINTVKEFTIEEERLRLQRNERTGPHQA